MLDTLAWLLVIEFVSLAAFPLAFALFPRLPDRGYAFAKPLGLVLLVYPVWLLGSLGVVPAGQVTVFAVLAALTLIGVMLALWHLPALRLFLSRERRTILVSEGVFLLFFLGWTLYRAYDPVYTHTEQPMDLAFLNASMLATSFPPADPWLSGNVVSYYYFGHLINAVVAQLSFVSAPVAYNLGLSLVAGLAALAAFGLVYNLARLSRISGPPALVAGLAAPLLLLMIGNLAGVLELAALRGWGSDGFWGWLNIKGLSPTSGTGWVPTNHWWWWNASRLLSPPVGGGYQETISEFPFFSLLLGDLHAHLMALPYGLLTLAFGLNLMATPGALGRAWFLTNLPYLPFAALMIGAVAFVNVWDLPTYAGLFVAVILIVQLRTGRLRDLALAGRRLLVGMGLGLGTVALALLLYLPFYLHLGSQASGILPIDSPVSRTTHQVVFWGPLLFIVATLAITQLWSLLRTTRLQPIAALVALGTAFFPFVVWRIVIGSDIAVMERFLLVLPWSLLLAALVYRALIRPRTGAEGVGVPYALLLAGFGVLLVIGPELFFVVDFFGTRMNTLFKLYYQAWTLQALASAWGLGYVAHVWGGRISYPPLLQGSRLAWEGILVLLLLASLYYPLAAIASKAGDAQPLPTLDGLALLGEADEATVQWLREHATPQDTIVEAVGGSYSEYGRLSAFSGIPAVLGWEGHEHQWRGSTRAFVGRADDVACIYTCQDVEQVEALLRQYDINYVVVGARERQAYRDRGPLTDFANFLDEVQDLQVEGVAIYRVLP